MLTGAHSVIFSKDAEADRAFFRDILKLNSVDVGGGWLIFGLPPSELAVHPSEENNKHELYLMCENIKSFIAEMSKHEIRCSDIHEESWGLLTKVTLPGGGQLGVYQPKHAQP